jgi:hypothetical protein
MSAAQPTVLKNYKARLAGLPQDKFIGSLVWFSISGTVERPDGKRTLIPVRVPHDTLKEWFDELDLDPRYLPPQPILANVFRRVTSDAKDEYKLSPGTEDEKTVKLRVEEIDYNPEYILRHVMRDVIDPRKQNAITAHCATLKFLRAGRTSKGKRPGDTYKTETLHTLTEIGLDGKPTGNTFSLPKFEQDRVAQLIADINAAYADHSINLHSNVLRAVIRNYLVDLNAIAVKPQGAVYFVHNSRQPTIDSLQALVERIGQGCYLHQVPLLDTHEQRQMLTDAFQDEVQDDIRVLLADVAELNVRSKKAAGKISPKKYAECNTRLQNIMSRADEYTRVLGLAQGRSAAAIEMGLDVVMDLATRIDPTKGV